jgi:acyl-coenzyme A synthetase/AMP-(fatty) acid ligase
VTSTTRHLGVDLQSWSPDRLPLINAVGELVILQPMPSMPIGFWRDDDGSRYCAAYFEHEWADGCAPGVCRHGDRVRDGRLAGHRGDCASEPRDLLPAKFNRQVIRGFTSANFCTGHS